MKKALVFFILTLTLLLCLTSCHKHKYGEWSVIKYATCTEDGTIIRCCDCGESQRDTVPAVGHNYVDNVCINCGDRKDYLGCNHKNLGVLAAKDPTCTETGLTEGVICLDCNKTITEQNTIPALDHSKRTYAEKDEKCRVYYVTVCDRNGCEYTESYTEGFINHSFTDWELEKNYTDSPCGIDKVYKRVCTDCSQTEKKVEPTPDHNYETIVVSVHCFDSATGVATIGEVKYTCQNDGCNSTYSKYEGHEYTQTIIESTCAEQGYTLNTCSCGHSYKSNFADKLPHTPGAEATCTTAQTCTKCPEIITHSLGHDWKEATCTEPKTCQRTGCEVTEGKANGHVFGEWVIVKNATETEEGLKERTCFCGEKETENIPEKMPNGLAYVRDGDYIYFGEYPQTIKADDVTITDATDYRGYYLGSDGSYYAQVTADPWNSGYTFSTGATVTKGTVYYFKVEPIRWRILSEENGEAFLLCDSIVTSLPYQSNCAYDSRTGKYYTTANGAPEGTYPNNYKYSEIRAWLNATFYEIAFTYLQQNIILTTEVDNSVASTGYTSNPYVCENTYDKLFLLSYAEVTDTTYGFSSSYSDYDTARKISISDYSIATGTWMSNYGTSHWWLRSPCNDHTNEAHHIYTFGYVYSDYIFNDRGVVPALRISL